MRHARSDDREDPRRGVRRRRTNRCPRELANGRCAGEASVLLAAVSRARHPLPKPPNTDGLIEVQAADSGASAAAPRALEVTPLRSIRRGAIAYDDRARRRNPAALRFALASAQAARLQCGVAPGNGRMADAGVGAFGIQGWQQAITSSIARRRSTPATTGGDSRRARATSCHGPLLTLGKPFGQGDPIYHPLYGYFLALVHGSPARASRDRFWSSFSSLPR